VTASDEDGQVEESLFVGIDSRAPVIDTLIIVPNTGVRPTDTIVCNVEASDPDLEAVSTSVKWYRETIDGTVLLLSTESTLVLSTDTVSKDQTLRCEATVTDESNVTTTEQTEIVIANTAPELLTIGLIPTSPSSNEPIECSTTATDLDGDAINVQYTWEVDGVLQPETSGIFTSTRPKGSTVACTATVDDGFDVGNSLSSVVTVTNTLPEITAFEIVISDPPLTDSLLTTSVTVDDLDNDPVLVNYDWYVDGELVKTGVGSTLNGVDHFDKGQEVLVVATPNDGTADGLQTAAPSVIIENSLPSQPVVGFSSNHHLVSEDLHCDVFVPATDPDGDPVDYVFEWTVNGADWLGATDTVVWGGDSINTANLNGDDEWSCTATASDDASGTRTSESVSTRVVSCPVQYTYDLATDFDNLNDVQDCWSAGFDYGEDPSTFTPFHHYHAETDSSWSELYNFEWLSTRAYVLEYLNFYTAYHTYPGEYLLSYPGLLVSSDDHANTLEYEYGHNGCQQFVHHNPDVLKVFAGFNGHNAYVQWTAPMANVCTLDLELLPVGKNTSGCWGPGCLRTYYTDVDVHFFLNDGLVGTQRVNGYNNNLFSTVNTVFEEWTVSAGDTVTMIFTDNVTPVGGISCIDATNAYAMTADWVQLDGGFTCLY
jgi:hypothetical protein